MILLANRLFLLAGSDFKIKDGLEVRHPKLKDIVSLGNGVLCEDMYWLYLSTILADPYENMVWLDDRGLDYEKVSPFYVFCVKWLESKEKLLSGKCEERQDAAFSNFITNNALSFYFGDRVYELSVQNKNFRIYDKANPDWYITQEDFDIAHKFICSINCIDYSGQIKPATKSAKMILLEDMRDEQKRRSKKRGKSKSSEQIAECVASVLYGGCGRDFSSIFDCGIYFILSGGKAINKKMRVNSLLHGIYAGTVKTESISSDDLSWSN